MDDAAILLLAGGKARRFPGKLERHLDGEPMIVRSYRRLRASPWPVYVAAKATFPAPIDAAPDPQQFGGFAKYCAPVVKRRQRFDHSVVLRHHTLVSLAMREGERI